MGLGRFLDVGLKNTWNIWTRTCRFCLSILLVKFWFCFYGYFFSQFLQIFCFGSSSNRSSFSFDITVGDLSACIPRATTSNHRLHQKITTRACLSSYAFSFILILFWLISFNSQSFGLHIQPSILQLLILCHSAPLGFCHLASPAFYPSTLSNFRLLLFESSNINFRIVTLGPK